MTHKKYQEGQKDGRAGFMQHSGARDYVHGYRYGWQEYDYWNSPSAFDEAPAESSKIRSEDGELTIGSVIGIALFWIILWAPVGLIFGGESAIFNIIFWGGFAIITLAFIIWLIGLFPTNTEKDKTKRHQK